MLDLELLNDYRDNIGIEVVRQMLALYIEQSENYLADILLAANSNSDELWHDKCHKMKGAAGSSGLVEVRQYLVEIEWSQQTPEEKVKYYQHLRDLNEKSINAFKAWLN